MRNYYNAKLVILVYLLLLPILSWGQRAGDLDTSFHTGTGVSGSIVATKILANGKILIAGSFTNYQGVSRNGIARLNADGIIDTSFNPGTGLSGEQWGFSVASMELQSDGKIIIAGQFSSFNGFGVQNIARIHSDGRVDTSFYLNFYRGEPVTAMAIQNDGKIIICSPNGNHRNIVKRLNDNGSLDTTFHIGGTIYFGPGDNTGASCTAIQSDGKILVGGYFSNFDNQSVGSIVRLNIDGTIDTSFYTRIPFYYVSTIAIQQDGRILVGTVPSQVGGGLGDYFIYRLSRLNSNGTLDMQFSPVIGGCMGGGSSAYRINAIAIQPNGNILIGGHFDCYNDNIPRNGIARIKIDGTLDTVLVSYPNNFSMINALSIQPDEKIIVSGTFTTFNSISAPGIVRIHNSLCATPTSPTISGATTFCAGSSTILTSSAPNGNLWSTGDTTRSITVNTAGSYSVRVISLTCTSAVSNAVSVAVTPLPSSPTITGNSAICVGRSTVLTSSALTGNIWSTGATTRTITVNTARSYTVRFISGNCTSAASNPFEVTQIPLPSTPTISGANTFCAGGSTVLTSSATEGNIWSTGATTRSITVTTARSLTVRVVSGTCTSANSSSVTVSVTPLPSTPTISGSNRFCAGSFTLLTSSSATGNLWSTGDTTRSISVTNVGSYSVRKVTGACTSLASNAVAVSMISLPSTPTISGVNSFSAGGSTVLTSSSATGNLWSNGAISQSITVNRTGSYSVRIVSGSCTTASSNVIIVTSSVCPNVFTGNGNYDVATNWLAGFVPVQGAAIRVSGNMTLNQSIRYSKLVLSHNATITIGSGFTFTVTDSLNNAGTISGAGTLKLDGNNNQVFGGGTIANLLVDNAATIIQNQPTKISTSLTLGISQVLNLNNIALTLLSTQTSTAFLAEVPRTSSISNSGNFTVQRWLNPINVRSGRANTGNYYLLGPVVQGQTMNLWNSVSEYNNQTFIGTGVGNLYLYNPTANNWYKPSSASTSLPVGAGIQVWFGSQAFFGVRSVWSATGVPQVGNYNLPITANQGFHLLSNPYPSTIDWDSPNWTKINVADAVYIYDWANRRYKTYIDGVSINGGSRYLPTAQGFFVSAENNFPVLTAREDIKVSNQVALQRVESQVSSLVRIQMRRGTMTDEVVIAHRPNTQLTFEPQIDARKMMNPATNIFVGGTVRQSIASMDLNSATVIPIELLSDSTGMVTLSTTEFSGLSGGPYYLVDEITTEVYPYTPQTSYQFYLNANQPYSLSLRLNNVNGISDFKATQFEIYPNPATNKVTVNTTGTGTLEILSSLGQVVLTQRAVETNEINISKLANGVYIVRFNGVSKMLVVK